MQCVLPLLFLPYCPSSCILSMWLSDVAIYPAGQTRNIRFRWPVLFRDSPQSLTTLCQFYLGSISPTSPFLSLSDTLHQCSGRIVPAFKEASKLLCLQRASTCQHRYAAVEVHYTKQMCKFQFQRAKVSRLRRRMVVLVPRNMRVCNITELFFFKKVEAIYFMLCIFYHNLKKYMYGLVIPKLTSLLCNHDWFLTACKGRKSKCLCNLTPPSWAIALHAKAYSAVLRYASILHIFPNKSFCLHVFSLFIYDKTYFKV